MIEVPPRAVSCPRCGALVEWRPESRYRPFCSERCKLLDLGAWANEEYRVRGEETDTAVDSGDQRHGGG